MPSPVYPRPPNGTGGPTITFGAVTVAPNKTRKIPVDVADPALVTDAVFQVNGAVDRHFISAAGVPEYGYTVAISRKRLGAGATITVIAYDLAGYRTINSLAVTP
jgi:hypothetical protein